MKHYSRLGLYKASNVKFDPIKIEAISYDWWTFVKVIDGKVVFNEYPYSTTTRRHQYKVRQLMRELGIDIDLVVETKKSLTDVIAMRDSLFQCSDEIDMLKRRIANPRSRGRANAIRIERLGELYVREKQISELV